MPCQFILDIWPKARSKCYSVCYTELIVEDLPHITTIWTLWQRALSTISFVTVSRHSAHCLNHLYAAKLKPPGAMRLRARGHDFELPTVKFEFNKRNFIARSLFQYVWLCIYRFSLVWLCCDFKDFYWGLLYDFSVMCILFIYCCKHVRLTCIINFYLLYLLTYILSEIIFHTTHTESPHLSQPHIFHRFHISLLPSLNLTLRHY